MLRYVRQEHDNGCFYAGLAMLLKTTYAQAFALVHPSRSHWELDRGALLTADDVVPVMQRLGLKPRPTRCRRLRDLRHDTLLVIRWSHAPGLSHTFVWDSTRRRVLDPACDPSWTTTAEIKRQLYSATYVNRS